MPRPPQDREDVRGRIIVALDVPDEGRARELVAALGDCARFLKVGLELWAGGGADLVRSLTRDGFEVFADLKLHDIPNTVAGATRGVAALGARFLTVHEAPPSVEAASDARRGTDLQLLGVTYLTSLSEDDARLLYGLDPSVSLSDAVVAKGRRLLAEGCDGLVTSPREVAALRAAFPDTTLVTPGVRPGGSLTGDQARVATPEQAAAAGADYMVVGRPIRDAGDPAEAFEAILDEAWQGYQALATR